MRSWRASSRNGTQASGPDPCDRTSDRCYRSVLSSVHEVDGGRGSVKCTGSGRSPSNPFHEGSRSNLALVARVQGALTIEPNLRRTLWTQGRKHAPATPTRDGRQVARRGRPPIGPVWRPPSGPVWRPPTRPPSGRPRAPQASPQAIHSISGRLGRCRKPGREVQHGTAAVARLACDLRGPGRRRGGLDRVEPDRPAEHRLETASIDVLHALPGVHPDGHSNHVESEPLLEQPKVSRGCRPAQPGGSGKRQEDPNELGPGGCFALVQAGIAKA